MKKKIEDYKGKNYKIQCKTQKEWDEITKLLGYKWIVARWDKHEENSVIYASSKAYESIDDNTYNYPVLQASDFLEDSIPEYVKCTKSVKDGFTKDKIYKVENDKLRTNTGYLCRTNLSKNLSDYYGYSFIPSTEKEYLEQNNPKEESLIGRYVKKIKSDHWNNLVKVGEYDVIIDKNTNIDGWYLKKAGYYYSNNTTLPRLLEVFELMPENFQLPTKEQTNSSEFKILGSCEDKYEVNKDGIIRNANTKLIKSQSENTKGYLQVNVSLSTGETVRKVHRLVAEAFIPNPNNYDCVDHINGNKKDNSVENLRWCSIQQNNQFYKESGGLNGSKLIKEDIIDIYKNYNYHGGRTKASEKYDVSLGTISQIKSGLIFKHITNELNINNLSPIAIKVRNKPKEVEVKKRVKLTLNNTKNNQFNKLLII